MGLMLLRRYFIMARDAPKEAPTSVTAAFEVPTLAKAMLPMRCLHWPKQCSLHGAYIGQSDGAYTSKSDDPYGVPTLAKGMCSLQ